MDCAQPPSQLGPGRAAHAALIVAAPRNGGSGGGHGKDQAEAAMQARKHHTTSLQLPRRQPRARSAPLAATRERRPGGPAGCAASYWLTRSCVSRGRMIAVPGCLASGAGEASAVTDSRARPAVIFAAVALATGCGGEGGEPSSRQHVVKAEPLEFASPSSITSPSTLAIEAGGVPGDVVAADDGVWAAINRNARVRAPLNPGAGRPQPRGHDRDLPVGVR
jgi:hypothetical protein